MNRSGPIVPLLAVLALLAAVPAAAQPGPAQVAGVLRRAEIEASGARDVFTLLETTRRGWLWSAGDPENPVVQTRTLIYIDGRYVGDLRVLRGLTTDGLASVRHLGRGEFIRSRVYIPHMDVQSAFFLTSRRASGAALDDGSRVMVTLGIAPAARIVGDMREHLVEGGYERTVPSGNEGKPIEKEGIAPAFVGTLRYLVRPGLSVEAGIQSNTPGRAGGYTGVRGAVINESAITEVFALVDVGTEVVRIGAGPSLRRTSWKWATFFCACGAVERSVSLDPGLAADLALTLPGRSRAFVEVRVQGRYYGSTHTPGYTHTGVGDQEFTVLPMERDPATLSGSLLLGLRL